MDFSASDYCFGTPGWTSVTSLVRFSLRFGSLFGFTVVIIAVIIGRVEVKWSIKEEGEGCFAIYSYFRNLTGYFS